MGSTGIGLRRDAVRELLAERDFSVLLGAQFLAQAADGFAQAVFADVLLLEPLTEGTPGRVLALSALTLLPYSLMGPFLGVFVDRWGRRSLLVYTNVARAAILATLPVWGTALPGRLDLYAAALVVLGFGRLFLTTKGAALPALLHERYLLRGNSLSGGGGMISALLGGIVGIGAVSVGSPRIAFVLAGTMYALAALIARGISTSLAHARPRETLRVAAVRIAAELGDGIGQIWRRAHARWPLLGIFVLRVIGIFVGIAAILVIKESFPHEAGRLGRLSASALALGAAGFGAFVGAVVAPILGRRFDKPGLIVLGFAASGAALILLGGIVSLPAILGLTFVGGLGGFVSKVAVDAQVQEALPDEYRGRAFAVYDILYNVATVLAALAMFSLEDVALRTLLAGAGVLALVLAAVLAAIMRAAGVMIPSSQRA